MWWVVGWHTESPHVWPCTADRRRVRHQPCPPVQIVNCIPLNLVCRLIFQVDVYSVKGPIKFNKRMAVRPYWCSLPGLPAGKLVRVRDIRAHNTVRLPERHQLRFVAMRKRVLQLINTVPGYAVRILLASGFGPSLRRPNCALSACLVFKKLALPSFFLRCFRLFIARRNLI